MDKKDLIMFMMILEADSWQEGKFGTNEEDDGELLYKALCKWYQIDDNTPISRKREIDNELNEQVRNAINQLREKIKVYVNEP